MPEPQNDPQAVKKLSRARPIVFEVLVTPDDLKSLRLELSESLSEFGVTLKHAIDPKSQYGFSRQYISRLEKGKDVITDQIKNAFLKIAAQFDGVPGGIAGSVYVKLLAQPSIPEGVLLPAKAQVVKCATPGCPVWFVKIHPRQKYHDESCRSS